MCGIVGYIGHRDAKSIILKGLQRLEYRGYDSAGIALFDGKNINITKTKGKVSDLDNSINKIVVSRGNPFAKLMIIGEAPGAKEEEIGEPFVGRSGKLLDKLLQNAGIDVNQDVYFCNVVKCRPPQNRRPTKIEIQ